MLMLLPTPVEAAAVVAVTTIAAFVSAAGIFVGSTNGSGRG